MVEEKDIRGGKRQSLVVSTGLSLSMDVLTKSLREISVPYYEDISEESEDGEEGEREEDVGAMLLRQYSREVMPRCNPRHLQRMNSHAIWKERGGRMGADPNRAKHDGCTPLVSFISCIQLIVDTLKNKTSGSLRVEGIFDACLT